MEKLEQFDHRVHKARKENRRYAPVIQTAPYSSDPVSVYRAVLSASSSPACLMESAERGVKGRYSFICLEGAHPSVIVRKRDIETFKASLHALSPAPHETIPFIGGAAGFMGHEAITLIEETVKTHPVDPFHLPKACFYFFRKVIIFDHREKKMHFVANVPTGSSATSAYEQGCREIRDLKKIIGTLPKVYDGDIAESFRKVSNLTKNEYCLMVEKAKRLIEVGEIFQVVLSQRFSVPYRGDGLSLYSVLEQLNPSPNMFHMRFGPECRNLVLLGSSPEIMVCVNPERTMRIKPIAGTRLRGKTAEEDLARKHDLESDPKECAEHRMLVDLARNDIGKQCEAKSITVPLCMEVEYYSHVMHLVSEVQGRLRSGVHHLDACLASFPGTLTGAPKVRALQIIAELETSQRGPYGGGFGWITDTALHTCIIIRSAALLDGVLSWQSGGGIVYDSIPEAEFNESDGKARAIAVALERMGGSNER